MDLSGRRIGKLQIIDIDIPKPYKKKSYTCLCDCGKVCTRLESSLKRAMKSGTECSCGCTYIKYLVPGDSERCKKAGLHRQDSFVNGCNLQMTFREGVIKTNTSGRQGISWSKSAHKWHVYIGYKNKRVNLCFVEDFNDACRLRDQAEKVIRNNKFEEFYYDLKGFHLGEERHRNLRHQ